MARRATLLSSVTKGCLDPDLSERIDLKHFYDSVADAWNCEGLPQGGFSRRAGTMLNSDADVVAAGLGRRIRRRIQPIDLTAGMITLHNGGIASNLVDQDVNSLFTTTAVAGAAFVVVEFDLGGAQPVSAVDVIGFFCSDAARNNALVVEFFDGAQWREMTGGIDAGLSTRRHLRTRGSSAPIEVRLASTQHFELKDAPVVDGVQTVALDLVLVKDAADPVKNGVYTVPLGGSGNWGRASIADNASEVLKASYFVREGVANARTTWVNEQKSLNDLNSFDRQSSITYGYLPIAGRTRRFGVWPGGPAGIVPAARYWRIVAKDADGAGAISVAGVRFWKERREVSPAKAFAFDRGADAIYTCVLSERNLDVFKRHVVSGSRRYVASIPVPIAAHQVADVVAIQSRDTMILFHPDVASTRIVRQGGDVEWNWDVLPAYNVPALPAGAAFAGDQDEIQDVAFSGFQLGDRYVVWLGDVVSPAQTFTGLGSLAATLSSVIGALPGLSAPAVTQVDDITFRVQFSGASGSRAWPSLQIMPLNASAAAPKHTIVQPGFVAGGPWFGEKTGWPRCGFFVQGRVLLAGFRAAPDSWGVSAIASYNFRDDPGPAPDADSTAPPLTADMAYFRTLDTDQIETIQQVFVGRNLQLFTSSSEWYIEGRTLDATQPANAIRATGKGIKASVRVVFAEGSSIIVQQGGRTINDFLFSDVEQSYKAEPLSLLGPHLLTDVVDVGFRKAETTQEANRIFFINRDGSLVTLTLLRSQDVIGMWPHSTDGQFRGIVGHYNGDVVYLVRRQTQAHGEDVYLEMRDTRENAVLDAAIRVSSPVPVATVGGLEHLEGKEVWAYAGSELSGPYTVENAQITIPGDEAATEIVVGQAPPLYVRGQKLRDKLQNDQPFRPPARIYEVGLSLKATGPFEIRVNGGMWREVPLTFMDGGTLDFGELAASEAGYGPELPLLDRLLTGDVVLRNLRGWSRHAVWEMRQLVPAPFHVKAARFEVAMRG